MDDKFAILSDEEFLAPIYARCENPERPGDTSLADGIVARMDNDVCRGCHARYKEKFPGKPFKIECQGIFREEDYQRISKTTNIPLNEVKDVMDPVFWAEKHIQVLDKKNNPQPFIARNYQVADLACTAKRKIDRMGRGLGKSTLGVIEELHKVTTIKNYNILVLCPGKAQAQKWYDDILWQCEQNPGLGGSLINQRQAPYYRLRFGNGSTISIFTAGSSSGRGAQSVRSQTPKRIRLEEQDLLNEDDYKAVIPLLRRYPETEFHGASTPTGAHSDFWAMCTQYDEYREFYYPISVHPDWSPDMEAKCKEEARTEETYQHEFLAEFGDLKQGVFKSHYVDLARRNYKYDDCKFTPSRKYIMGFDWNGQGTGTKIRIVEYNPETHIRKLVQSVSMDGATVKQLDGIAKIRELNKYWHCERVYIDYGFGNVQDELLRLIGSSSKDPFDKRLLDLKIVDFGASLETNHLVDKRASSKYVEEEPLKRPTKPFMVEGAVMTLENGYFEYAGNDKILDDQLRAYRVKTYSQHGFANTYASGNVGDHDLDATMLALLGVEMEFGLFKPRDRSTWAHIAHTTGFGTGAQPYNDTVKLVADQIEHAKAPDPVPSRTDGKSKTTELGIVGTGSEEGEKQIAYMMRNGAYVVPNSRKQTRARVPSRTTPFKGRNPNASSHGTMEPFAGRFNRGF